MEGSSREAGAAQAAQDQAGGSEWVAMSDPVALSRTVGVDAASQLPEAVAGYAASKGIGCDPASARVDASSVRSEGAGVGFVVDTGPARLDVVYADGGYGFKIL
ncbi:MAG: hypothetical protein IJ087_09845 [Eggerthellaceae bacterium]|nr:hypothetical protein [Eggerthellaceae bacterium]